jgi:hypothetical protein
MDGKSWGDSEAVKAVCKLSSSLPHLKPVLVAFFTGALETWERFTEEFDDDGDVASLTSEEREKAWLPPTNDVNEGALGALRAYLRKKPNTTMHQYNALAMFRFNNTSEFAKEVFLDEDYAYIRKHACERSGEKLERE